jgi:hypothetical protein
MRQELRRAVVIAFLLFIGILALSQTRLVGARSCTPTNLPSGDVGRGGALVPQAPCAREHFSEGPLYIPAFAYSKSSLSFTIPAMVWSALGKAILVPSRSEKVAPDTTTYWFLRVSQSSPVGRLGGSFVSSASAVPGPNEVLEYIVVSDAFGISTVRFPISAQLLGVESRKTFPIQSTGTAQGEPAEVVAQASVGALVESNGTVLVNPSTVPAYASGQIAVGDYAGGSGLKGLFTAGTAGNIPNPGNGIFTWGNGGGTTSYTRIDVNGDEVFPIGGVSNTAFGVFEVLGTSPYGCDMDANANWGCNGGLFGNAAATPVPNGTLVTPTTYPSPYGGPVVIAQSTSGPTPQSGSILVSGTSAAVTPNICSVSSGVPCNFTWMIASFSSGIGATTQNVPASSVCKVTAGQTPIVASNDVMTMWITGPSTNTLTVHAQDLLGTYSGSFAGYGNCA